MIEKGSTIMQRHYLQRKVLIELIADSLTDSTENRRISKNTKRKQLLIWNSTPSEIPRLKVK